MASCCMSHTTLHIIDPDGDVVDHSEYRNAHGSAPQVWSILQAKYIDGACGPMDDYDIGRRTWFLDGGVLVELYAMLEAMDPIDAKVILACADYVIIRREAVRSYAEAMLEFESTHKDNLGGQVFHIGQWGRDLIDLLESSIEFQGVCWTQTSVCDDMWTGEFEGTRRDAKIEEALREAGVPDEHIQSASKAFDGWDYEDSWCRYNVNIDDRHTWVPEIAG